MAMADGDGRYFLNLVEEVFAWNRKKSDRRQRPDGGAAEARAELRQGSRGALQSHLRLAQGDARV